MALDARRRWTPRSTTSSAAGSSCRSASSGDSTPATAQRARRSPAAPLGRLLIARAATHDPDAARRVVHRGLRRHLPRPPHPRLRRAALRHGRGDRRGLRRRRRARNPVVRRPRRRRRGRRRAQAQRRCACHPVRDAARSTRLRRPARALRNQRQRCRRRRCPQPAPLTRGGRGATGLTPLRRLHAAIRPGLPGRARSVRGDGAGRRSQRLHAARGEAPHCSSRSPQTARESNGDPSQSTRSPSTPVPAG